MRPAIFRAVISQNLNSWIECPALMRRDGWRFEPQVAESVVRLIYCWSEPMKQTLTRLALTLPVVWLERL